MHSVFSFLIDGLNPDPNAPSEDITSVVTTRIDSYFEHYGDKNNSYQPLVVILPTGRYIGLVEKGDYRGRDEWPSLVQRLPLGERWSWALKFPVQCLATDMKLWGAKTFSLGAPDEANLKIEKASRDELIAAIFDEIPKRLSAFFADFKPFGVGPLNLDLWQAKEQAKRLWLLCESPTKSFGYPSSPYEYRAFDLRQEEFGEEINGQCGIVLVDVHT